MYDQGLMYDPKWYETSCMYRFRVVHTKLAWYQLVGWCMGRYNWKSTITDPYDTFKDCYQTISGGTWKLNNYRPIWYIQTWLLPNHFRRYMENWSSICQYVWCIDQYDWNSTLIDLFDMIKTHWISIGTNPELVKSSPNGQIEGWGLFWGFKFPSLPHFSLTLTHFSALSHSHFFSYSCD